MIIQIYNPLFERVSQIQAPSSDTSDLDKTLLRGIASFIRLTHSTIENVELRNMGALPENLSAWLLHIFERHPDKSVRK